MRHCTIPEIFHVRDWFEKNYGKCCQAHDIAYQGRYFSRKYADDQLLRCMLSVVRTKPWYKRAAHYPFCYATYVFVRTFGWLYWNENNFD